MIITDWYPFIVGPLTDEDISKKVMITKMGREVFTLSKSSGSGNDAFPYRLQSSYRVLYVNPNGRVKGTDNRINYISPPLCKPTKKTVVVPSLPLPKITDLEGWADKIAMEIHSEAPYALIQMMGRLNISVSLEGISFKERGDYVNEEQLTEVRDFLDKLIKERFSPKDGINV